jgi:hypothetical protein
MPDPITNEREFRVFSLRRSGQHALIYWLARHFKGEVLFANNVTFSHADFPRLHRLNAAAHATNNPRAAYVFNVEDTDLATVMAALQHNEWDTQRGVSARINHILLVRDPYNLFASRLRCHLEDIQLDDVAVALWKQHAREWLGFTRHLPADTVRVSYNDWVGDGTYRTQLATQLQLPPDPTSASPLRRVPQFGGGSSFDRLSYQGRGDQMQVLDRWRACRDEPEFVRQVLHDAELRHLAHALLGAERFSGQFADLPPCGQSA